MQRTAVLLVFAACAALLCACHTPPEGESDLPWNMPQQWENAPGIPGLDGR